MTSHVTEAFRVRFKELPAEVQKQARKNYKLWKQNPHHPSLLFKKIHDAKPIYSVRISRQWRAVGVFADADAIVWFWIGSHAEYDRLIKQL